MDVLIPVPWKNDVCAVLKKGDSDKIVVKIDTAQLTWQAAFPNDTRFDLFDTLADALSKGEMNGRNITNMREPGEIYEFLFSRDSRLFVGKINLCPDRQSVIIYSAHISLKGQKL